MFDPQADQQQARARRISLQERLATIEERLARLEAERDLRLGAAEMHQHQHERQQQADT